MQDLSINRSAINATPKLQNLKPPNLSPKASSTSQITNGTMTGRGSSRKLLRFRLKGSRV